MHGTHDPHLVILSILVAILASYAALDLASRVGHRSRRTEWIIGGSIAMGTGIWSMHYVAMLAMRLPVPMVYDIGLLALSLLIAVGAAGVAFLIVARGKASLRILLTAGGVMGAAIAGMHYSGMWALAVHTAAWQTYDPILVAASLLVAYVASVAALWLAFYFRTGAAVSVRKIGASVVMGFAIAGMHYTAMAAVSFTLIPGASLEVPEAGVLGTPMLATLVAGAAVLVLALGIAGAAVDRGVSKVIGRTEARFRLVVENVSDVITLMRRDGTAGYVSPAIERILGYTPAECVGRRPFDIAHPNDKDAIQAMLEQVLREAGATTEVEAQLRHKDGSWRRIELHCSNLLGQPGVDAVIVTSRDVTARHQLEERLAHAQRMEAVGRLAGGIAHDFNNLLTVIKGHASFALDVSEESDPRRAELDEVLGAAERAAALTSQLLAFSRRQVLKPKRVDLNEIVKGGERMLSRVLAADVEVEIDLADGPGHIRADPGQIEQVFVNLMVNARDAMPEGGRITIRTWEVFLDDPADQGVPELGPGRYVVLSVRDSGVGMSPEQQVHIFEPFFTTKAAGKGTGLGLATAYGIIQQSGGAIRVRSAPGHGSTFEVFLPRSSESGVGDDERSRVKAPLPRAQQARTIMVVEDDRVLRRLIVRTLEASGHEVLDAESPSVALRLAREHDGPIHLLISDVVMPGTSGGELAAQIRASRPDTRVLFISGYTPDEILRRGVSESATPFLAKPFMPDDLVSMVHELLTDEADSRHPAEAGAA